MSDTSNKNELPEGRMDEDEFQDLVSDRVYEIGRKILPLYQEGMKDLEEYAKKHKLYFNFQSGKIVGYDGGWYASSAC